ncbi:phage tail protein [Vibrio metschnikovii]|jgi:phage protein U|uniref:phage tail protein n=1 Tax=Vibrio parahaemolyticus TaxID=670 RepID=UPI001D160E5F|nr:phage tail protein [Vibrio parahaemolyticus]EKO3542335.1 phage tail protein [Vibrio fluvialis]EKO3881149.1 phage tail protein [Vibrio metschnikovii]EHK2888001.1 phage tail protein [Vibrio parahaemolyticus]EIA5325162.1 phage tail protein [Vibrio parahaemolyticus]EII3108133.1 phage tail protein [Vibrio parahaemolyticus]
MAVMMALGSFQFSINTMQYQSLKTSMGWRWAKMDRVGRKPARQFKGPEGISKSFDIAHYPQDADGLTRFDEIQAIADEGKPIRLVGGALRKTNGQVSGTALDLGLWVIEKLDLTETQFLDNGIPLEMKGSITISEYGEDQP